MATETRGKVLRDTFARSRGTCPVCGKTRIKLLFEIKDEDKNETKVCKNCRPKK